MVGAQAGAGAFHVESTRASLSADHVRLYKALGGGWTRALELSPQPPA